MSCFTFNLDQSTCYAVEKNFVYEFNCELFEDITDRSFHFKIKEKKTDSTYILELTDQTDRSVSGVFKNDIATGNVDVQITSTDNQSISVGNKYYEFYYVFSGQNYLISNGNIQFM